MNKLFVCMYLLWLPFTISAQAPTFSLGDEENYAFEVKIIDEFIERFNGDNTLIVKYIKENKLNIQTDRNTLLKGLFFREARPAWNIEEIKQFISEVNSKSKPVYLSFYDTNWFAEVNCKVLYKGKPQQATLILKVKVEENNDSKWIINGVRANFLPPGKSNYPESLKPMKRSLNPVSHATDFMGLHKALTDKDNLQNYFSVNQLQSMGSFIEAIEKGDLEYIQVNNIIYHFLQIPGWIFTVQQINRQAKNSGWLISRLIKADDLVKENYEVSIVKKP